MQEASPVSPAPPHPARQVLAGAALGALGVLGGFLLGMAAHCVVFFHLDPHPGRGPSRQAVAICCGLGAAEMVAAALWRRGSGHWLIRGTRAGVAAAGLLAFLLEGAAFICCY